MDRSQRLTDGTRWRTFMRLLLLDDLITAYTNARPGAGLLVVDPTGILTHSRQTVDVNLTVRQDASNPFSRSFMILWVAALAGTTRFLSVCRKRVVP
jgi:hypothetical protein